MRRGVNESRNALSEAERYAIWCDEVRLLFAGSMKGFTTNVKTQDSDRVSNKSANNGESSGNVGKHYDEDYFPYCFYTRMLSSSSKASCPGKLENESSGTCDSSVTQKLRVDEDALAKRLTSKLNAQVLKIKTENMNKNASTTEPERGEWPFRDASVEVLAASVNQELHDLHMYVRQHNLMAEQLRRQLLESRRLIQLNRG